MSYTCFTRASRDPTRKQKTEDFTQTGTTCSYLSESLQHLRGLILLALLGHQHHLLDHTDAALVRRRWGPAAAQPVPRFQHEGSQDVAPLLGGCSFPAVLGTGSCRLLAFGLLGSHGAGLI